MPRDKDIKTMLAYTKREDAEERGIRDFRMPQANRVHQPGGKGTTVVVELSPNSGLAKRLMEEAKYRYLVVLDYTDLESIDYEQGYPTREEALAVYLRTLPDIKHRVVLSEDCRGPALNAPNRLVEVDFLVITPEGNYQNIRFTDENIGHVCTTLNIAYYQTKK
ncbi:hypothetical protein pEaSNUABM8_00037 [Erwinia phage pEa_SNUABM_8]|nr:hypothetical protein pEaSNUABM8_00037 [Erwinia phage pEa_SNUABM_8]QVW54789.1 hypothetical protein pEaSNUABM4_00036 [Erwinia phage pEa_SNUABM_4]